MVAFVALMASCDDDYVEIDSLQVFGEEFFAGETVNVGMSVRMSDPDKADYYWECNGGNFVTASGIYNESVESTEAIGQIYD